MFVIASSGRCGTLAICNGLTTFSDYNVMHEPEPRLLEESYLKHHRLNYKTDVLINRIKFFEEMKNQNYGESFRAPNILDDISQSIPSTKFLIIIRDPLEYILSAHYKLVFQKDDIWDRMRLIPLDPSIGFTSLPLAEKICWHWVTVNHYLLDFVEARKGHVKLVILTELIQQIQDIAYFIDLKILDPTGLANFLSSRPNSSSNKLIPEGYCNKHLEPIYAKEWERANMLGSM